MKSFTKINLVIVGLFFFFTQLKTFAQSPCSVPTPSFVVNLTGNPTGIWTSPNISRGGACCGTNNCVYFYVTLDPNTAGIQIDLTGADPAGSLFYNIGCAGNYPGGSVKCISGVGPHEITFCKPGNNSNTYKITSIAKPLFPKDDSLRIGCKHHFISYGVANNSVTWNSIYPGTPGQYNNYLDSVHVASPTYSPQAGAPAYIDYQVCGTPLASMCGYTAVVCDTVRVYNFPKLNVSVAPNPATFCNLGPGSGVMLNGTATGGAPTYSFTWQNSASVTVGTGTNYFATAAGNYSLTVKDGLYNAAECPSASTVVAVSIGSLPVVHAGPSQKKCSNNPVAALNGTVQNATGGIWSGGTGTFSPANNVLNASYSPSASELSAGFVKLYLTSTGTGGNCYNKSDSLIIYYSSPLNITLPYAPIACYGGSTVINSNVTGGTHPYGYLWNTGSTSTSITAGQGNYTLSVTDSAGCNYTRTVSITQPALLNSTVAVTSNYNGQNISCYGLSNGSASASVNGGTGPYSYTWSSTPAQQTASANNLAAGIYTVTVQDANNCSVTQTIALTQPPLLTSTALASSNYNGHNISCFGLTNGSAQVNASGGTGAYSYSWTSVPTQTTASAVNLGAGTYSITVHDINNCSVTNIVTLTQPSALTSTAAVTSNYNGHNISCFGYTNGSASVTPNGGTSPYSYSWSTSPVQTTNSVVNLGAGAYTVTVTDNNGCLVASVVNLTQPAGLGSTVSVVSSYNGQQISCFGGSNGSATVNASNGTAPFSYTWSTLPAQTGTLATNLSAGTYSVFITDVNGCALTNTVTLTDPASLSLTAAVTSNYNGQNISCYGLSNGSASASVNGGTGPYSYTWSSTPAQQTASANNLAAGIYTVTVQDANNCSVTQTIALTQPPQLTSTALVTSSYNGQNISCYGLTNGSAQVNASGGTGSYTYSWTSVPTQSTASAVNLGAGTYSITVSDTNNCSVTQVVTLTQPTALTSTAAVTSNFNGQNVSCFGYTDGSASVTANGGTSPYSYSWSTAPTQTTSSAANLGAGSYTVTVTDTNGCSVTSIVNLTQPAGPSSTVSVISNYNGQQISCFGASNGSVTANASNGTAPFSYTWSTVPVQTGTLATNLGAGTYSVFISDANGCILTDTVVLTDPAPVSLTTAVTSNYNGQNISCFGLSNGSASVSALGGTAPYSYNWTSVPTQSAAGATNLSAGSYSITVTDVNGCSVIDTVTLSQPLPLNPGISSLTLYNGYNVSCYGSTNGNVNITMNGGTGAYTYQWSNSAVTQNLSNVGAGNYVVVVKDLNGCTDTLSFILTQPPAIIASIDSLSNYNGYNVKCHGSTNGSVFVTVNGGVSNYAYTWSNGNTNQNLTGAGYGNYSLSIVDQNSCTVVLDTMLTEPPALSFNSSVVQPDCNGFKNGVINVSAAGGVNPFAYQWSNGAVTQNLNGITSGTYNVVYSDKNNCSDSALITVNQPQTLTLNKNVFGIRCYGDTLGGIDISADGGTAPYNYLWSNGSTSKNLNDLRKGIYSVIVTDQKGCAAIDTIILAQPDSLKISLYSPVQFDGHNISYPHGNDGSIQLTVNGGSGPYSYLWSDNEIIQDISNLLAGTYNVAVTDKNGCRVAGGITLTEPNVLEMPSGFSPNNDGKNDLFVIHGIEAFPDNQLTIYNRWGNIVYEKSGYNNEWNGSSNNGHTMPDATYFVVLDINSGQKVLKGFVELRR